MTANNNRMITVAALLCLGLLQAGCSTMDEAQCRSTDWQERGRRDGERGRKPTAIGGYEKACREFGVQVDTGVYRRGWDTGIEQYCTREEGWKAGMSAFDYNHACPKQLEAEFYSAYQLARSVRDSRAAVDSARRDLDEVLEKLAEDDLSDSKRSNLKQDKKRLKKALSSARAEEKQAVAEAREMGFSI